MAKRLGEILVEEAILGADTVERAVAAQGQGGRGRLGQLLVESGALEPSWLTAALALQAGVETVDPLSIAVDPAVLWRVPPDVAERTGCLVGRDEHGLVVVVQDPSNTRLQRSLSSMLGVPEVRFAAGLPDRVAAAISRHYDTSSARARRIRGVVGEERPALTSPTSQEMDVRTMLARLQRQTPRTHADFATALLVFAVESGADSLTLESGRLSVSWDGVAVQLLELPAAQAHGVATRLRTITKLDAGANRPGSAEGPCRLGEANVELSAQSQPGPAGGRVEVSFAGSGASKNAMHPRVHASWRALMNAPGLIVLAVPEGTPAADPPETPARVERRTLTDWASVEAAVRAAETGRTVLATISAPGVAESLARLRDLAPSRSAFASVLTGSIAARRLRQVCQTCARPAEVSPAGAERLGVVPFAAPRAGSGCPECGYRRYSGTVWSYEVVVASQAVRDAVDTGAPTSEIGRACSPVAERAMQVDAVAHAILGLTTAEELERCVPPRPPWAVVAPEERHRGLFRAVTDAVYERDDDPNTQTSGIQLPGVLLVHPGEGAATTLRAALQGRAEVTAAWSAAAARVAVSPMLPVVGVLTRWGQGGWDAELIAEWQSLGMRVILMGPPGDIAEMAAAFELNADEYAGSIEELGVRLGRWLPSEASDQRARCSFG